MRTLLAIAYPDEGHATEVMEAIKRLHHEGRVDLDEAVAVVKDTDGLVHLHKSIHYTTRGATLGLVVGTIVGFLLAAPWFGALYGAISGAFAESFVDVQDIDEFVRDLLGNFPPGSSVVMMTVHSDNTDAALSQLQQFEGQIFRLPLSEEIERQLTQALSERNRRRG